MLMSFSRLLLSIIAGLTIISESVLVKFSGRSTSLKTGVLTSSSTSPSHFATSVTLPPCIVSEMRVMKKTTLKIIRASGSPSTRG